MKLVQRLVSSRNAPDSNLRRLYVLRYVAIVGQAITATWVNYVLGMPLPLLAMGAVISILALFNVLTGWRLKRALLVTDLEIALQLLIDVAALTVLLYLSGGASNPFVSLYLLPLLIAAITLSRFYTVLMTAVTMVCYTLLMFRAVPLPVHHGGASDFDLHRLGMWFNFVLSAMLIILFIAKMAATLRERDRSLAAAREENLRNERIVAIGTFAAGAAHELGTPLSIMAVITRELEREYAHLPALIADVHCLRNQVNICKGSLTRLLAASGQERSGHRKGVTIEAFLDEILEQWRFMRPMVASPLNGQGRGHHR